MLLTIGDGAIEAGVATAGGALTGATWRGVPFLRQEAARVAADSITVASFPFVPFGGRVAGNRFDFEGRSYDLAPNVRWDAAYLHGDAWLMEWTLRHRGAREATLEVEHEAAAGAPYAFFARQHIAVRDGALALELAATNRGWRAMPFGLGQHPHFPLTPATTLALDGGPPVPVPPGPVDRGFAGWGGHARIAWPERRLAVDVAADGCGYYVLYIPDAVREPGYARDYFCFEPMTHGLDAHHRPGLDGLRVLRPGETMTTRVVLAPQPLA